MRKALAIFLLFSCLMITGCRAALPFGELDAVKRAGDYYKRLYPGTGKVTILSTAPYNDGYLVLGKKSADGDALTVELMVVGPDGVSRLATGVPPGNEPYSVGFVSEGGNTVVFGIFNETWEGRQHAEKAVLTLSNWSTAEAGLTENTGYIIVLDKPLRVEKFAVMAKEDASFRQDARTISQTEFVEVERLPLPSEIAGKSVLEVEVKDARFGTEWRERVPEGYGGLNDFIAAFNSGLKQAKRATGIGMPRFSVMVSLEGERVIEVWDTDEASVYIYFSKDGVGNSYITESGDLYRIVNAWKNAPWKKE